MKSNLFLLLLFSCGLAQGKQEMIDYELFGRSLANYQACSKAAILISDNEMHRYYQNMFNDSAIKLLALSHKNSEIVYKAWASSELILSKLDQKTRVQICASRFDKLTRKVTSNQ